jgi:protein-disulfide isomerase
MQGYHFAIMTATLSEPVTSSDHSAGPENAPVTLVEYGDYECPNCGNAWPVIKELQERMGGRLRFVFRNFPQYTVHQHASVAAQAAEAAAAQGKFWEMHNLLYQNQQNLDAIDLNRYAIKLGLEIYRFNTDVSSERFERRVREDFEGGQRSGVKRTPTFFINGKQYTGERTLEAMLPALESAVAQA